MSAPEGQLEITALSHYGFDQTARHAAVVQDPLITYPIISSGKMGDEYFS